MNCTKYASMRNLGVKTITGSGPRAVATPKWAFERWWGCWWFACC